MVVNADGIDRLLGALRRRGYRTRGPVVAEGAVGVGEVSSAADLPVGWGDEQAPGRYRLVRRPDEARFAWAVGPGSLKPEVLPPDVTLWRSGESGGDRWIEVGGAAGETDRRPLAAVGVRPCEVAALAVLDRVLGPAAGVADPGYVAARRGTFTVVAECTSPSGTCFCASTATGPEASGAFDVALTELLDGPEPRYVLRPGSPEGAAVLDEVAGSGATAADLEGRASGLEGARSAMGRRLDTAGLPELLARNLEHPRYDEVAERCLSCGNCTLVCPTCFCTDVVDVTDLAGVAMRHRSWTSCFDLEHSYLHGGSVRATARSRYRQWLTHKLGTWWDQFGTSGCVGCGRCITWCPVGIDLTEEVAAIRSSDGAGAPGQLAAPDRARPGSPPASEGAGARAPW